MRNSSLVERFCAENVTGLKRIAEAADGDASRRGRRASSGRRRSSVSAAGVLWSEYAGISNDKTDEKSVRRKPKVSWAMVIIPGLGGP